MLSVADENKEEKVISVLEIIHGDHMNPILDFKQLHLHGSNQTIMLQKNLELITEKKNIKHIKKLYNQISA